MVVSSLQLPELPLQPRRLGVGRAHSREVPPETRPWCPPKDVWILAGAEGWGTGDLLGALGLVGWLGVGVGIYGGEDELGGGGVVVGSHGDLGLGLGVILY